jgi:hypothetical protein
MHEKCIEDIYKEEKQKTDKEIEELTATRNFLDSEIKKYAYKAEYGMVYCQPQNGDKAEPEREKKCHELGLHHSSYLTCVGKRISRFEEITKDRNTPTLRGENHQSLFSLFLF